MPELPEVETIVNHIKHELVGSRLQSCSNPTYRPLAGKLLVSAERAGKTIALNFGDDGYIQIHLGLSGDVFISNLPIPNNKFCIGFDCCKYMNCMQMLYGRVDWFGRINERGADPTGDTKAVAESLQQLQWVRVKEALLNQSAVGGVGNIYATEALFLAGQNPFAPCYRCDCEHLAVVLREVLLHAIQEEYCTAEEYLARGGMRSHKRHRHVYGRAGEPCDVCGTTIEQDELGGRKTYYCPKCQGVT